jgi:hypothetical protein
MWYPVDKRHAGPQREHGYDGEQKNISTPILVQPTDNMHAIYKVLFV